MEAQRVNPDTLSTPLAAYSQVVRKGQFVTTAGLIAIDADGNLVGEGDIEAQTRQTIENMKHALEAVGASLSDVIKTTLYLSDLTNYKAMNAVYNEYFAAHPPARATVGAELVRPSLLFEMDAIAVLDG